MTSKQKEEKLAELNQNITPGVLRNLNGSLEQAKEELRDAYMTFKDLQNRAVVDITHLQSRGDDNKVFYFKPDTYMLDDPEKQRNYRETLLKRITSMPKPEPLSFMADDLHRQYQQAVADRSHPDDAKRTLAVYFKRRQYSLQHLKYKLLCRWAHHSVTSESIERVGSDATFIYGKIEYSLENAMQRCERLENEEGFRRADPSQRPRTKSETGSGSLYVENVDKDPQSLIREDDVEIYLRGVTYKNKVTRVINKFMVKLKWLPLQARNDIFKEAVVLSAKVKNQNIIDQENSLERIQKRVRKFHIMTPELQTDLDEIVQATHVRLYQNMFLRRTEKVLFSWKAIHDCVPNLVANLHELKLRIQDLGEHYSQTGDIELDSGYSYTYQIQVFFPLYLQRQLIKSEFSIYDAFANEDKAIALAKSTLLMDQRLDNNVYKDMQSKQASTPSEDAMFFEVKENNLKVIRLKSAAYWIDYVCLDPTEPDWHKKQQAVLNFENDVDELLRGSLNFLDVNDVAAITRVHEDNAVLHQTILKRLQERNPHESIRKKNIATNEGDRKIVVDTIKHINGANKAALIEQHLLKSVTPESETQTPPEKRGQASSSVLRMTPSHLLVCFYTLRFAQSRDAKTKLLYYLNFFRAMQKRIALDLREFGTRERVDSHLVHPFAFGTETKQSVINQTSYSQSDAAADTQTNQQENSVNGEDLELEELQQAQRMTVFTPESLSAMKNLANVRQYKCNGFFNNRIMSTCPAYPKFHTTYGEPTVRVSEDMELDQSKSKQGITERSLKLMGRIDSIELDEVLEEVYVKDDFGIYVMFDCALQDLQMLEEELLRIASFYLKKSEVLSDPTEMKAFPMKDRPQILSDLLQLEAKFQYKKIKLVMVYMECYEHISDPLDQQRLMQIVIDIMARRPRLNLQANYFTDAYTAEFQSLDSQFDLMKHVVAMQIKLERFENHRLQDSLNLAYTIANKYEQNKWKYEDAEILLRAIVKKRRDKQRAQKMVRRLTIINKLQSAQELSDLAQFQEVKSIDEEDSQSIKSGSEKSSPKESVGTSKDKKSKKSSDSDSSFEESDYLNKENPQFQELLGIPSISIETLYQQYKEKDKTIIQIMNEHVNFIQIHEGFPEFITHLEGGANCSKQKTFKPCPWSEETGQLDFYSTLDFIVRLHAVLLETQQELYDSIKPYDNTLMTHIDTSVYKRARQQFNSICEFVNGGETEYEGRHFVEDESIMGSADKIIFYTKEFLANFTFQPKSLLNPFLVAKLDLKTISFFEFQKLESDKNKYFTLNQGLTSTEWILKAEKQALLGVAKQKIAEPGGGVNVNDAVINLSMLSSRNINMPTLLQLYSNLLEFMRLRNELILCTSECAVLQQVYEDQVKCIGLKDCPVLFSEDLQFPPIDTEDTINYVDEGPAVSLSIGLALKEFDKKLLSNLNFRQPDALKISLTNSGVEEIRAIFAYQLMQKQVLVVATRLNQLLLEAHSRAMSELELLEENDLAVPNTILQLSTLMSRNTDGVAKSNIKEAKERYKASLSSFAKPAFCNISTWKSGSRQSLAKEYGPYEQKTVRTFSISPVSVARVMRTFRLKLVHRYCNHVRMFAYLNATKIQGLQVASRLRTFAQYFTFDSKSTSLDNAPKMRHKNQIFQFETSNWEENFSFTYRSQDQTDSSDVLSSQEEVRVINTTDCTILNYYGIPSSQTLASVDVSNLEELRVFRERQTVINQSRYAEPIPDMKDVPPEAEDVDYHLKQLLPTFSVQDVELVKLKAQEEPEKNVAILKRPNILDYQEALYFEDSQYAQMLVYYFQLERILSLEWFIQKLQFLPQQVVYLDHAIQTGLPFWKEDDFEARVLADMQAAKPCGGQNLKSQQFFYSQVVALNTKNLFAEELESMGTLITNIIKQKLTMKRDQRKEYLNSYCDFRYVQVVGTMHKLVQQFYNRKRRNAIRSTKNAIKALIKMDHVRVSYQKTNSFHVNTALTDPRLQSLENVDFIYGSTSEEEVANFNRCVQPCINEKALELPQITLFQSLYQSDRFRRKLSLQFIGQMSSYHNTKAFAPLETAMLDMSFEDRQYAQSYIVQQKYNANDFMETVFGDTDIASQTQQDAYNLTQLVDAKKFLSDSITPLLLKNAVICWKENCVLPDCPDQFARLETRFKDEFFWKITETKERIQIRSDVGVVPSVESLREQKDKITDLQNNFALASTKGDEHRRQMILAMREEFQIMKKRMAMDNYFSQRAEIQVLSSEIERQIIKASVLAIDAECAALARCFTVQVPHIQMHIHPFQQFAAAFYDDVDRNAHLDVIHKMSAVQTFMTRLRNRGTIVETLTSGPGVVLTIKDLNECLQDFCRQMIKYGEIELKSRSDTLCQKETFYLQMIYKKDRHISRLEHRLARLHENSELIVESRVIEKGNQLIFELDNSNRLLKLFKKTMAGLESHLMKQIFDDQRSLFQSKELQLQKQSESFTEYTKAIRGQIQAYSAQGQVEIGAYMKKKVDEAKNIDKNTTIYKPPTLYPATGSLDYFKGASRGGLAAVGTLPGVLVPVRHGFKHYTHCSCYVPDPNHPHPTLALAETQMMSEQEARFELLEVQELQRKQRVFFKFKEAALAQMFQNQITNLQKQQSSNSYLWEQQSESEKREKILKCELLMTQQSLSVAESVIEKMKEELKKSEQERLRLAKYKNSKQDRLKELEDKVKQYEVYENVDTGKLINVLSKKTEEVKELKHVSDSYNTKLRHIEDRFFKDRSALKLKVKEEQQKSVYATAKVDQLKLELKMLESSDASVALVWKNKCLELFDVVQNVQKENEELRSRCAELIDYGIQISQSFEQQNRVQDVIFPQLPHIQRLISSSQFSTSAGNLKKRSVSTANTGIESTLTGYHETPSKQYFGITNQLRDAQFHSLALNTRSGDRQHPLKDSKNNHSVSVYGIAEHDRLHSKSFKSANLNADLSHGVFRSPMLPNRKSESGLGNALPANTGGVRIFKNKQRSPEKQKTFAKNDILKVLESNTLSKETIKRHASKPDEQQIVYDTSVVQNRSQWQTSALEMKHKLSKMDDSLFEGKSMLGKESRSASRNKQRAPKNKVDDMKLTVMKGQAIIAQPLLRKEKNKTTIQPTILLAEQMMSINSVMMIESSLRGTDEKPGSSIEASVLSENSKQKNEEVAGDNDQQKLVFSESRSVKQSSN